MYLSYDEIVEIHNLQISHYGGESGTLNHGNLDFTVEMQTRFTDPFEVAAFLLYNIATLHPFCDGNKRTAFMSAYLLLCQEGFEFNATNDDVEIFMFSVASSNESQKSVQQWLETYVTKKCDLLT